MLLSLSPGLPCYRNDWGYVKRVSPAFERGVQRGDREETAADLRAGTAGGADEHAMSGISPVGAEAHGCRSGGRAGGRDAGRARN
jgi:hypothetical protein